MTYREKMNIARWLYRKGPAPEKDVSDHFAGKLMDNHIDSCEFFSVTWPNGPDPWLSMTDANRDNYRAARRTEIAERRDWVEPVVSVLALFCSIAAVIISLVT